MTEETPAASATVIPFPSTAILFEHKFVCKGCDASVFAAVHYGDPDLCLTCQEVGPDLSGWLLLGGEKTDAEGTKP